MSIFNSVAEFHKVCGQVGAVPRTVDNLALRQRLIKEEADEVDNAISAILCRRARGQVESAEDWEAVLKELCDLLYVVVGFSQAFNLQLEAAFNRVHASNMSKLVDGKILKREDGKVLKGPNYEPPSLKGLT